MYLCIQITTYLNVDYQKKLAIIGATGSIGTQTLDIVARHPEKYSVSVLIANTRVDTLIQLAIKHRPKLTIIADSTKYWKLKNELEPLGLECASGHEAICDAVSRDDIDMVVNATVGYSGLRPTLSAIDVGKDIALANKETLVVAGEIINQRLESSPSHLYPIDSEHSAIWQCLRGENPESVNRLIITASGGPFRQASTDTLKKVSASDALQHPSWSMGAKITIDSATMLNKAFEIIEAYWLFNIPAHRIVPIVHPQSIVHSMVEFNDGSIKAQLGVPDMRLPIAYALGETVRLAGAERPLNFSEMSNLTFEEPDTERFPCINLAYHALERRGNTACIINAANEIAVAAFLAGRIKFLDIYELIIKALENIPYISTPTIEDYMECNSETRNFTENLIHSNY